MEWPSKVLRMISMHEHHYGMSIIIMSMHEHHNGLNIINDTSVATREHKTSLYAHTCVFIVSSQARTSSSLETRKSNVWTTMSQ